MTATSRARPNSTSPGRWRCSRTPSVSRRAASAASAGPTTSSSASTPSSSRTARAGTSSTSTATSTSTCSAPTGRSSSATSSPRSTTPSRRRWTRASASAWCSRCRTSSRSALADIMPCGEQTILVKTGSDATNAAVRAMRAYTGRDKIARCGYHGWGDWCVEHHGGVPQAVWELTKEFEYGDLADLERVFAENPDEIAGVIITPVGHPLAKPIDRAAGRATSRPSSTSATRTAPSSCFDEIRTGFRVAMGGASERYGVDARPHHGGQGDGERLLDRRPGRQARGPERVRQGRLPQLDLLPEQPRDGRQHEVPRDPRAREGAGRDLGARHALPRQARRDRRRVRRAR